VVLPPQLTGLYTLYAPNWTALYGTIRTQLVPLPASNPRKPSSRHILPRAFPMLLYSECPGRWTCSRIFKRSSGLTTVLLTAPAMPPAMKEATKFPLIHTRKTYMGEPAGGGEGGAAAGMVLDCGGDVLRLPVPEGKGGVRAAEVEAEVDVAVAVAVAVVDVALIALGGFVLGDAWEAP
jgi:hypothetical protein